MSPHNVAESSRVEMMAECPIDHPFFVKDKGEKDNYKQMIKSGNDDEMMMWCPIDHPFFVKDKGEIDEQWWDNDKGGKDNNTC